MTDFSLSSQKAVTSDAINIHPDFSADDDLSSAMATETLLAHDLVRKALPASSKGLAEQQIHHTEKVPGSRPKRESAPQLQGV